MSRMRGRSRLAGLAITGALLATSLASPVAAAPEPATLDVWLGGILTTATPGTPYEAWVNDVVARFKEANPGSDVKINLLPSNNDQLAAQVQAAFASKKVPDVMMLYSGAYTTAYEGGLRRLNDYVEATPGMWDQMILWDGACVGFDCQGGAGEIVGVPVESYQFMLWYRKDLLEQAGIDGPPASDGGALRAVRQAQRGRYHAHGLWRPGRVHDVQHADHEHHVDARAG